MTRAPGAGWNQTEAGLGDHVLRGVGYLIGYPTKPGYRSWPKGLDKENSKHTHSIPTWLLPALIEGRRGRRELSCCSGRG
jgi:hypothetical protein